MFPKQYQNYVILQQGLDLTIHKMSAGNVLTQVVVGDQVIPVVLTAVVV